MSLELHGPMRAAAKPARRRPTPQRFGRKNAAASSLPYVLELGSWVNSVVSCVLDPASPFVPLLLHSSAKSEYQSGSIAQLFRYAWLLCQIRNVARSGE